MNPTIFILIPVHNRLKFTKECLLGIKRQTYKKTQTILIDDGSTDGTFEYVRNKYPETHIIRGDGNLWWSKAVYLGVEYALAAAKPGDYVLFLNNDCYFEKVYLRRILKTARKYNKSIVSSLCVTASKKPRVVEAGVRIHWPTGLVYGVAEAVSTDPLYYKSMDVVRKIDALPGKGTLIPIEVFRKVGNINYQRLPHYIADYEFFNRAKRGGFELLVDTKAIVKHHWEATGYKGGRTRKIWEYKDLVRAAFSRKSMNNVVDWITFLYLACPRKYLFANYCTTLWRSIDGATRLFPFILIRPAVLLFPKLYYTIILSVRNFRVHVLGRFPSVFGKIDK